VGLRHPVGFCRKRALQRGEKQIILALPKLSESLAKRAQGSFTKGPSAKEPRATSDDVLYLGFFAELKDEVLSPKTIVTRDRRASFRRATTF